MNKRYLSNEVFRELFGSAHERGPLPSGIVVRAAQAANDETPLETTEVRVRIPSPDTVRDEALLLLAIDEGWSD